AARPRAAPCRVAAPPRRPFRALAAADCTTARGGRRSRRARPAPPPARGRSRRAAPPAAPGSDPRGCRPSDRDGPGRPGVSLRGWKGRWGREARTQGTWRTDYRSASTRAIDDTGRSEIVQRRSAVILGGLAGPWLEHAAVGGPDGLDLGRAQVQELVQERRHGRAGDRAGVPDPGVGPVVADQLR